jgi:1-acyl-sn-glycerol-3-phosphate acyltransferase
VPRTRIGALEARIDAFAAHAERRIESASARLRDHDAHEANGRHARELAQLLVGLGPTVRRALVPLDAMRRLFDGPGPFDAHGMDPALVAQAGPALDLLLDAWFRVQVRGLEGVPPAPAIVVANHGGSFHWDGVVLARLFARAGRALRPLLDEAALQAPLAGRAAARLGGVPATPAHALDHLAAGASVAVFPEGSRDGMRPWPERYRIRRFGRGGFVRIALAARAPIVPCAIVGSEEAAAPIGRTGFLAAALRFPALAVAPALPLGPLGALPLPSRWTVRFGDPIAPDPSLSPDDAAGVGFVAERVRNTLQSMLDEDVASRRSVYL